jgi:flagellar biosynthesis protein FlhF
MQIKRFEAKNMTEALRGIKKEFGPEAVILSARSLKKDRGIFGNARKNGVEVTAAIDTYYPEAKTVSTLQKPSGRIAAGANGYDHSPSSGPLDLMQALEDRVTLGKSRQQPAVRREAIPQNVQNLFMLHQQLLMQGVDEHISLDLIGRINRIAAGDEVFNTAAMRQCLAHILEEIGVAAKRVKLKAGNQKIVAFIGPTGVGKTTTIAKLAAAAKTKSTGKRVALITLDNYRIAAVEQLKIYAKIFGMPIETAANNRELRRHIKKLKNNELILIDTAGINPRNEEQVEELNGYFKRIPSIETHLLMSATTEDKTLYETLDRFRLIPIDRMIFTKLDECTTYGGVLNQLFRSRIPVSYFTNGQQIPDDLEVATLDKLLDRILSRPQKEIWTGSPESLADNMTVFERMFNAVNTDVGTEMVSMAAPGRKYGALA